MNGSEALILHPEASASGAATCSSFCRYGQNGEVQLREPCIFARETSPQMHMACLDPAYHEGAVTLLRGVYRVETRCI